MTVNSGSSTMIIAALATAAYFYPFICRPKRRLVAITIRHESRDKTAAAAAPQKEAQPRKAKTGIPAMASRENIHPHAAITVAATSSKSA
jgi:hypothetical protein